MKNIVKVIVSTGLAILMMTGCSRTAPLVNVNESAVVPMDSSKPVTNDQVRSAIIRAGIGLGWSMQKVKDGELKATLYLRSHVAAVRIPYNTKAYSIEYISSSNLKYNEDKKTIHSNYNGWISNLNIAIQKELSLINMR